MHSFVLVQRFDHAFLMEKSDHGYSNRIFLKPETISYPEIFCNL